MKSILVSLLALATFAGTANAKSLFDEIRDTAPRSVFEDLRDTAPRSVFDDIRDTAPRSAFDDLRDSAPRADVFIKIQRNAP